MTVEIALAALVKDGMLLLGHRHPARQWYPDCWDLIGGHIEVGESPEQAVRRECREEIAVDVSQLRPIQVELTDPGLVPHAFLVTGWAGRPVNTAPDEHDALGWFTARDLPSLRLADPRYYDWLPTLLTACAPPAASFSESVRLREAGPSDVRAIAEFQTHCWREAYRGLVPHTYLDRVTVDDREIRWSERVTSGDRLVTLAEVTGRERASLPGPHAGLVGVVSWGTTAEPDVPAVELKSLYVDAEYRGTGLAAALLRHALDDGPAHLWVFRDNPRAVAFYAKQGFAPDGRVMTDPDTGLVELRLVRRGTNLR